MTRGLRLVRVPPTRNLRSLTTTGPTSPKAARSPTSAGAALDAALALATWEESQETGWCCWWASPVFTAGDTVKRHLWVTDDTQGRRSLEAIKRRLEAACFVTLGSGRPSTPASVLRGESPLHIRWRGACMGQLSDDHSVTFEIDPDIEAVHVEPRWRWPVQACPNCGHQGHPLKIIDGKHTRAASFALALVEAVLGGGCDPEDWSDHDAQCSSCGQDFDPRWR